MPFGVKRSRSSSRARSMDSISTIGDEVRDIHAEDPEENQVNETINVNLSDKEYKTLHKNPNLQGSLNEALQDPVKKLWFKVFNQYNNNLKEDETPINLNDMTEAFNHNLTLKEDTIKSLIEKSQKELKNDLYKKNLSFHLLNPRFKPPTRFSETTVLHLASKASEALKLFPNNTKSKFSGRKDEPPTLSEFLFTINYAQDRLNLAESEFKQKFLTSLTGPAHETVRNLVEQGDTIPALYHHLTHVYDNSLDPLKSKSELSNLKIPKTWDLFTAQNKILELATAAARLFKENQRKTITNTEACQTLIRALPPTSSRLVRTQFNQFMTDQTDDSTEPLFIDFIRYLHRFQDEINEDIKKNGDGPDYRSRYRDNRDSKDRRYPLHYDKYPGSRPLRVQTTYANKTASPPYINRYNPYPRNTVAVNQLNTGSNAGTPIINKYMNKLYCSLCGKTTHTAADGCYAIKKNGVVVPCSPTQIPCHICEKVLKKKLFHPPALCFNKSNQRNNFQQNNSFDGNRRQK